jgi:hypothetical protein
VRVTDRYLKIILTIIAVELGWLCIQSATPGVAAQATATPVLIKGIDVDLAGGAFLPVAVVGSFRDAPTDGRLQPLTTRVNGIAMGPADRPLKTEMDRPVKVESDKPLKVQNVDYTPSPRPGE